MAENFLLYSEVTPQLSPAEHAWFQDQLQVVYLVGGSARPRASGRSRISAGRLPSQPRAGRIALTCEKPWPCSGSLARSAATP
jgi:hypothetical protein